MKQTLLALTLILTLALFTPAQRTDKPQAEIKPAQVKVTDLKAKKPQKGWKRFFITFLLTIMNVDRGEVVNK